MKIKIMDKAPNFSLKDQDGNVHNLSNYKGKWLLLYFYPKDNTPGCTKEACQIRDSFPSFKDLGIAVLGISADSVESHKKFAQKYNLPFPLLSDEDKKVIKSYGVLGKKKFMGKEFVGIKRTSFLIDPYGKIFKIYENVSPDKHAKEVLEDLKKAIY